jgi:hypothetical protein
MARCPLAGKAVTGVVTRGRCSHNHRNQVTAAHRDGHQLGVHSISQLAAGDPGFPGTICLKEDQP